MCLSPLPEWHYLISGDREAVHRAGKSIVGRVVSETVAGPLEQHIVWPEGMEGWAIESDGDPWTVHEDESEDPLGSVRKDRG
jgi:hypothetical protein